MTTRTVTSTSEASTTATSTAAPIHALTALHLPGGKPHLTLGDTRSFVERDDRGKWDIMVPRRDLIFQNGELVFPVDLGTSDGASRADQSEATARRVSHDRLSPSPFAFGQLCGRLGIPTSYIRQCPPDLQDENVNFWLQKGGLRTGAPKRLSLGDDESKAEDFYESRAAQQNERSNKSWRLRARNGTLRAVLSQRFSPLDNAALLETLTPLLPPHYRMQWIGLEDESFHLRIIDPTRSHAVLPGDDFFVGVHIANSEVGYRSLTVDAMVYRLVCSNGLVALVKGKSLLRQRHIHVAAPRFKAALEEALGQALSATQEMLSQLQGAAQQIVPDGGLAIERLARHWHLSDSTEQIAKNALMAESSPVQESAYGLVNAFTAAAQLLPDEKRYDLEMLAGSLAQHGVPQFALSSRELPNGREPLQKNSRRLGHLDVALGGTR